MNLQAVLRKNSFYLFIATCLIFIGFGFSIFQKDQIKVVATPSPNTASVNFDYARVIKVYDGDTIEIEGGKKVRYIGIDSAEVYPSAQCYSNEERVANEDLVLGKEVKLLKDISDTDKYGRLLRYVYVGDIFINDYLVKNGLANLMTVPPDTKYQELFADSESYAKENKLGLWSKCGN